MRITCPSCAAVYDVPADRMAGRTLKCARCAHSWVPVAALPPTPPVALPVPEPPPLAPPAFEPPPPPIPPPPIPMVAPLRFAAAVPQQRRWPLAAAWALSLAVLVAVAAAAFVARAEVMQAWPPSERVYAALGLR